MSEVSPATEKGSNSVQGPTQIVNINTTTGDGVGDDKGKDKEVEVSEAPKKVERSKRSIAWEEFEIIEKKGLKKGKCNHCGKLLTMNSCATTSSLKRHLELHCPRRKMLKRQQGLLNYQPSGSGVTEQNPNLAPAIVNGKYDSLRMREAVAHWILMHEHSFAVVEEEGFNFMMQTGIPQWEKISRVTGKSDCMKVYTNEKQKLKTLLLSTPKISLTTDLWKSKNQKIGYMVITGHFVDSEWQLNKWVLNCVHIPPPHRGIDISDAIYKCLKEWGIENKIYSITMDNASSNDSAIRNLKESFSVHRKLVCGGRLFHVRCCAHILNLIVRDGLSEIKHVIEEVRDSVSFINGSEGRLRIFAEIVQQMQLPFKKLVLDCKTRWNSTYEMLTTASRFKDVFPRYQEREPHYDCCPLKEDWVKVERICEILEVFSNVTNIISGSDYPTSNLFLCELSKVKQILDGRVDDEYDFIRDMVKRMKDKFDKYWGECNLLIVIAAVLDPRLKMRGVNFCISRIYNERDARAHIEDVKRAMIELYNEYVDIQQKSDKEPSQQSSGSSSKSSTSKTKSYTSENSAFTEVQDYLKQVETYEPQKTDLDLYLEEKCHLCAQDTKNLFDILDWWKGNQSKYPFLSKMAFDILVIPITSVASEATFSAGGRVIDSYRASLSVDTVQALLCGGNWVRNLHGVKSKKREKKVPVIVTLPKI